MSKETGLNMKIFMYYGMTLNRKFHLSQNSIANKNRKMKMLFLTKHAQI